MQLLRFKQEPTPLPGCQHAAAVCGIPLRAVTYAMSSRTTDDTHRGMPANAVKLLLYHTRQPSPPKVRHLRVVHR